METESVWDNSSAEDNAYVSLVGATMVVEGVRVVDGHGDVHHTGEEALLATSIHRKWAVVDQAHVKLVEV